VRKLFLLSACGLVLNAVVLAGLYLPGGPYTEAVFWLPFIVAFLSFGASLYIVNDRRLGSVSWTRLWGALRTLPPLVQIGLALMFVANVAHLMLGQGGTQTELGFKRLFAGNAVWLCAVGTALLYGALLRSERGEPAADAKPNKLVLGFCMAIGLGLAVVTLLLNQDPIYDETATHERLAAQFGGAAWYSHLIAANTYHGAFVVYLDTEDPGVQAATCTDLKPVAAQLGRIPDLYYASGGHGSFVRSC
jgi:hypothetical protein